MPTPSPPPTDPTARLRDAVVDLARLAPSVHNTQPWCWRTTATGWELHVDRTRALPVADVSGRELVLSCGAALHHAYVAALALGADCHVERWPDPSAPDLLARVQVPRGRSTPDPGTLDVIRRRRTDRRRFTSDPVTASTLADLCAATLAHGIQAVPVTGLVERLIVEQMVGRARIVQSRDPRSVREHRRWSTSEGEGVSPGLVPDAAALPLHRRPRFGSGVLADDLGGAAVPSRDSLVILASEHDDPTSWLAAGEALSAIWLRAEHHGVSVVPLSQVTEVRHTRAVLHTRILAGCAVPQLLLRVGRHDPRRLPLPARQLRPRTDVVDPDEGREVSLPTART